MYLFVALSKGWQVNSREIPERQTVIEVTLLFLGANLCMYWYEYLNPPPIVSSEYLFDSGAGLLIIAIRVTMFVWFVGSAKQTRCDSGQYGSA